MKIVRVTYTVRGTFVERNRINITKVMSDLREQSSPGIHYHVCLGADGKTFSHTAFFLTDKDQELLFAIASFQTFQQELKASSPEIPPKQEFLTLVGSSQEIFN